jgi:hypothetical protein
LGFSVSQKSGCDETTSIPTFKGFIFFIYTFGLAVPVARGKPISGRCFR